MPAGGTFFPGQAAGPWLQYRDFLDKTGNRRQGILSTGGSIILTGQDHNPVMGLFRQDATLTLLWNYLPVPLPANQWPICLTNGSDGAIWFTEPIGLGRLTSSYEIRQIVTTAAPAVITAGPDGAMWFTEPSAKSIGTITSTGSPAEFRTPATPEGIATGPDGALWFTEPEVGKIGRMTTDGHVTEYGNAGAHPWGIAAAKDALWFSDLSGAIGKIDLVGTASLTPIVDPSGGHPGGAVAIGPDGSVWFTESPPSSQFPGVAGKLGRIDPNGSVQLFSLPDGDKYMIGLTIDAGGHPWTTTQSGSIWEYRP
jgi:virginiamycin B lyase